MAKVSGVKIKTKIYKGFKGVDFTTDPSQIDDDRSPNAVNLISDKGGMPEKRPGYRTLIKAENGPIYGIYPLNVKFQGIKNIEAYIGSTATTARIDTKVFFEETGFQNGHVETGTEMGEFIGWQHAYVSIGDSKWTGDDIFVQDPDVREFAEINFESFRQSFGIYIDRGDDELYQETGRAEFDAIYSFGYDSFLVHEKNKLCLYEYDLEDEEYTKTVLSSSFPEKESYGLYLDLKIWILTGEGFYVFDGTQIQNVKDIAYVPLTVIGSAPSGGGTKYEDVNMLTLKQRVGFLADGTSTDYYLPYDDFTVQKVVSNGTELVENTDYTVQINSTTFKMYVKFTTAPSAPSAGEEDNVFITYTPLQRTQNNYIEKCTTGIVWGVDGAADRLLVTGNANYPNYDFISQYMDGTYWPDTNYMVVGSANTSILGYRRSAESLAIFKDDDGRNPTVYIRYGTLDDDGNAVFTTRPALSGIGAISKRGFGNINDDQLALTSHGVFALTTNNITTEKISQNRSLRIDPKLTLEILKTSRCINFRNNFLIFVNNQVYGLDGVHAKYYTNRNDTDFIYECFYWDSIPAICVSTGIETNGEDSLYFGTSDGRVCKFNYDIDGVAKYKDELPVTFTNPGTLTENSYDFSYDGTNWMNGTTQVTLSAYGITAPTSPKTNSKITITKVSNVYQAHYYAPVVSKWFTKYDDDGDSMVLKTLLKKGNCVTVKPYNRSSAKIMIRTDRDSAEWQVGYGTVDLLDWEDIDFARFSFVAEDVAQDVPINHKIKNYKRLQIGIMNDALDEGFGIYGITKHYVTGNFSKK